MNPNPSEKEIGMSAKKNAAQFAAVYAKAVAAGMAAGNGSSPTPMIVGEPTTFLGSDINYAKPFYYVADGACGFAWVTLRPATSSFARWLKKTGKARVAYGGGMQIWVSEFGQSMARKEAYADAMAATFRSELGVEAYAGSRMD
jgi:hypothetical protein